MHIKKKTSQHRRDFRAVYQCEHCDHEVQAYGYDDVNFHQIVIPAMECPECGKTADGPPPPHPTFPRTSSSERPTPMKETT